MNLSQVMDGLMPLLERPRGSLRTDECWCAKCGDTNPDNFGTNKRRCLSCRRDERIRYVLRKQEEADFQRSMETLRIINSFPPRRVSGSATFAFLLWLITFSAGIGIGWSVGRMTAPDLKLAYMIECDAEQMERVKSLAREYKARGVPVIGALTRARLEVCL